MHERIGEIKDAQIVFVFIDTSFIVQPLIFFLISTNICIRFSVGNTMTSLPF